MDDIARHLSVSKKTLYQHFAVASKDEKTGVVMMTNSGQGLNLCTKLIPLTTDLDIKPTHRFFD